MASYVYNDNSESWRTPCIAIVHAVYVIYQPRLLGIFDKYTTRGQPLTNPEPVTPGVGSHGSYDINDLLLKHRMDTF